MTLNAPTSISAGLCGVFLTVLALRAPSLLAEMERKGTVPQDQLAKFKRFLRPGCIIGALCCLGAVLLGLTQK
jgi:hypothetical protein